jgi:hypothetical protein
MIARRLQTAKTGIAIAYLIKNLKILFAVGACQN